MEEFGELSENHHEVLLLTFFDQLDTREIGDILGLSRAAVAMRVQRALDALRRRWSSRQDLDQAGGVGAA